MAEVITRTDGDIGRLIRRRHGLIRLYDRLTAEDLTARRRDALRTHYEARMAMYDARMETAVRETLRRIQRLREGREALQNAHKKAIEARRTAGPAGDGCVDRLRRQAQRLYKEARRCLRDAREVLDTLEGTRSRR